MIQLYQIIRQLRVLAHFLKDPYTDYHLRELARVLKMDPMTLKRTIDPFLEDGLILKRIERGHHLFRGNIEDIRFRYAKIQYTVDLLVEDGMVERITDRDGSVISIVLFGSAAKGTDGFDSDHDILIISPKKKTQKMDEIHGHEVNVVLATPSEWSLIYEKDRPFYDEVLIHGIALFGRKPVVR
jgi:predicted nucleotidyltransferase